MFVPRVDTCLKSGQYDNQSMHHLEVVVQFIMTSLITTH